MNLIRSTIIALSTLVFISSNTLAKCNFGFILGDDIKKVEKDFGTAFSLSEISSIIEVPVEEICPNENLGFSFIEYHFLNNELAAFQIIVENDADNTESEKLLLYNYVKKNYGAITDKRAEYWRGFKSWNKNGEVIVYKKMNFLRILEEELYISNNKYNNEIIAQLADEEDF